MRKGEWRVFEQCPCGVWETHEFWLMKGCCPECGIRYGISGGNKIREVVKRYVGLVSWWKPWTWRIGYWETKE